MEYSFQQPPMVLISGDGRVFTTGPQIAIYPGPMLPNIEVRTITEEGIQTILAAADEAGLFADVDYTAELNVADASTATVVLNVDGESWVHEAYALGIGGGPDAPEGSEATPEHESPPRVRSCRLRTFRCVGPPPIPSAYASCTHDSPSTLRTTVAVDASATFSSAV